MTRICVIPALLFALNAEPRKWETLPVSAVKVRNDVSNCLQIEPQKIAVDGLVARLTAQGTFVSNTGECGCKSALLRYTVVEERTPGQPLEWVSALVSTRSADKGARRPFNFVLSSDASVPVTGKLTLAIRCTHD
jgi:hypothetical protein